MSFFKLILNDRGVSFHQVLTINIYHPVQTVKNVYLKDHVLDFFQLFKNIEGLCF